MRLIGVFFSALLIAGCGGAQSVDVSAEEAALQAAGSQNSATEICHRPDANGEGKTLSVSSSSVAAHLAHGDFVGPCLIPQ